MAGTGPAPKPAGERRRRNEPARGEWVELDPHPEPVLPSRPPARAKNTGRWSARTLAAWKAWREDPVSQTWGPADLDAVVDLAHLHHAWSLGDLRLSAELRLRMDGLGLTPKGRRDLRLRVRESADVVELDQEREQRAAKRRRLRAVDPAAAR